MILGLLTIALPLAELSYSRPFLQPLPIWDYKLWLLLPLALGVSIVYKSIRCDTMREVPKATLILTLWIIGAVIAAAVALGLLVFAVAKVSS